MQRLLNGMSWSALAIVAMFCVFQATEWVLTPASGVIGLASRDVALGWLSRLTVFLITGGTMLVTALVVLNAAGRAGRENSGVAGLAAGGVCRLAAAHRHHAGAGPGPGGRAPNVWVFPCLDV